MVEGLRLCLWLGMVSLHVGFAGVAGVLLRRAHLPLARPLDRAAAFVHTCLLLLPSTVLVLHYPDWAYPARLGLVLFGLLTVWVSASQPAWTPARLWQRSFGHRYFAAVMLLAAIGGLGLASAAASVAAALVGAAASIAGAASLITAPPRA